MEAVTPSSDAAGLLRDANVTPGNVSSFLKDFEWDDIFFKGENADAVTAQLREFFPGERPSTIANFSDLIMNGCGGLSIRTNKKTEVANLRPDRNKRTLEHYRGMTKGKQGYVSNVLLFSCGIASSITA